MKKQFSGPPWLFAVRVEASVRGSRQCVCTKTSKAAAVSN